MGWTGCMSACRRSSARPGFERIVDIKLNADEQAMMSKSIEAVKGLVRRLQDHRPLRWPDRAAAAARRAPLAGALFRCGAGAKRAEDGPCNRPMTPPASMTAPSPKGGTAQLSAGAGRNRAGADGGLARRRAAAGGPAFGHRLRRAAAGSQGGGLAGAGQLLGHRCQRRPDAARLEVELTPDLQARLPRGQLVPDAAFGFRACPTASTWPSPSASSPTCPRRLRPALVTLRRRFPALRKLLLTVFLCPEGEAGPCASGWRGDPPRPAALSPRRPGG